MSYIGQFQSSIRLGTPTRLVEAVTVLMNCGHDHRFVVEKDSSRIYASNLAVDCLRRGLVD